MLTFRRRVVCIGLSVLCALLWLPPPAVAQPPTTPARTVPFVPPLAWSGDGVRIAVIVGNNVEIRDTATGQTLQILVGHTDYVPEVAWSPDGTLLAAPSSDQTLMVWRAADGALLHTLTGHEAWVSAATWTPDGSRLLSWGFDIRPNLFTWDAVTGVLLQRENSGDISLVSYSPDGQKLALSGSLNISIRDGGTLQPITRSTPVDCCTNRMDTLAWSPDSSKLVTGSLNGLVTLWDANTLNMLGQFIANPHYAPDSRDVDSLALSWVRDVAFAPDGQSVRAVSGDGTIREWSLDSALLREAQIGALATAAWSPYTARLAVLELTTRSGAGLAEGQAFEAGELRGDLRVVIPFAASEEFTSLAQMCGLPETAAQALSATANTEDRTLASALNALPTGCAADLRALAEAIRAQ